jgi:hypothetical protein
MHRGGNLDHDRIARLARQVTWERFRSSIAAVARRGMLAGVDGGPGANGNTSFGLSPGLNGR